MNYIEAKKILDEKNKIAYPSLQQVSHHIQFAQMLQDDFAGDLGELSAITQYIKEKIYFEKEENQIARILLVIAIEEMRHLEMLGDLIQRLGGQVRYANSLGKYWTGEKVKEETGNLAQTMWYNIETEKAAIKGYQRAMMHTRNPSIRALLKRIILDEQTHIKIFTQIALKEKK